MNFAKWWSVYFQPIGAMSEFVLLLFHVNNVNEVTVFRYGLYHGAEHQFW